VRLGQTKHVPLLGEESPSRERGKTKVVRGCFVYEHENHPGHLVVQHRGPFGGIYTTNVDPDGDIARVTSGGKIGLKGGSRLVTGIPPMRHVHALKELGFASFVTPMGRQLPTK